MTTTSVLEPESAEAAAAMLADAAQAGTPVIVHGQRTTLRTSDAGRVALSTLKLTTGLVHYAGDLVASVPAGMPLRDLNATLAAERQWLPLDPPHADTATIGGIVASNAAGPRRHHFGSPRDLVIGVEVALTSGRVARSGGRVVKNVAGYDLGRLFAGSYGSLGVITHVNFKLAPIAPTSRTVVAKVASLAQAAALAQELAANASLTPTAIELLAPEPRLLVRFESTEQSGARMADATTAILASASQDVTTLTGAAESAVWGGHQAIESAQPGLIARISVLPTRSGAALQSVSELATQQSVTWEATGRLALGSLRIRTVGAPSRQRAYASGLRAALSAHGGHVQFEGDLAGLEGIDPFGPLGASAAVARAVKQQFDPTGILPYPWEVR